MYHHMYHHNAATCKIGDIDEYIANFAELNIDWALARVTCEKNQEVDCQGELVGRAYLGSWLNINYSGKYYLPFACSNVDPCPMCHGKGHNARNHKKKGCSFCNGYGSQEAYLDELLLEELESVAKEHGFYIESGEGDPTDIFLCMSFPDAVLSDSDD